VFVSALVFPGGAPDRLLRAGIRGHVAIVTSPRLLAELAGTLSHRFGWGAAETERAIRTIVRASEVVENVGPLIPIARDPDDDWVIATARSAGVAVIVTGDKDLLDLGTVVGIRILRPRAALDAIDTDPAPHTDEG
jgi:uncharacterized protein